MISLVCEVLCLKLHIVDHSTGKDQTKVLALDAMVQCVFISKLESCVDVLDTHSVLPPKITKCIP